MLKPGPSTTVQTSLRNGGGHVHLVVAHIHIGRGLKLEIGMFSPASRGRACVPRFTKFRNYVGEGL